MENRLTALRWEGVVGLGGKGKGIKPAPLATALVEDLCGIVTLVATLLRWLYSSKCT